MNIALIHPRQMLIGLAGLVSGMACAFLIF